MDEELKMMMKNLSKIMTAASKAYNQGDITADDYAKVLGKADGITKSVQYVAQRLGYVGGR